MTTEPRQEAEQIVREVLAWHWASGGDVNPHPDRDRLVDALAAGIKLMEGRDGWPPEIARSRTVDGYALTELFEALSALREDET